MLKIGKCAPQVIILILLFMPMLEAWAKSKTKEFLTEKEIEEIQDARKIDARVDLYLLWAKKRLKTAEERLTGKEAEPGDPFEFFSPEDLVDGYYEIIKSVMANLDNAYQNPKDLAKNNKMDVADSMKALKKALGILKTATEATASDLEALKKLAEKKQQKELWNSINKAIEITKGAHEGAESGLSQKR
jgi:hypothetical protein